MREQPQDNFFQNRLPLADLQEVVAAVRTEIGRIIVGQDRVIDLLICALLSDGHVLIEGVPGVAKTLTAKLLARTVSVGFSRIQFTPDLMPSDVTGTSVFNSKTQDFEFRRGPIFSNIVLIDEINRAPAKTQSALFEAMEERQITADGHTYPLDTPFLIVATQNPVEQEGTYRLPEAQLDRFHFKIEVDYPSLEHEIRIISEFHGRRNTIDLNTIQKILTAEQLRNLRAKVCDLHVEPNLMHYIAQIVNSTRNNSALFLGASPRASLAILTSAKAMAAMQGRDFVTPDDIKMVATPVLQHRVMLTPEKEMEGSSAKEVITQLIQQVEVPR
jgi:MoxR-like ATPase